MGAEILDGRGIAGRVRAAVATQVAGLTFRPGLAVVLVGDDPASAVYVRNKDQAAQSAGIAARTIRLPADAPEAALLATIAELNADPEVDGILVQFPLPRQMDAQAVIEALDPAKDVDGFHPLNVGRLQDGLPTLAPCTPRGVMHLLAASGRPVAGARAVVLGRSRLVGRPLGAMLLAANATVTIAHSHTADIAAECRRGDILVAAVGRPGFVQAGWVRPGAVLIDVGINRLPDGRLVGDADPGCAGVAGWITPVPGGVGPMTIACLLENTLTAALARRR